MVPSIAVPASWTGYFMSIVQQEKTNDNSVYTSAYGLVGVVSCAASLSLSITLIQEIPLFFSSSISEIQELSQTSNQIRWAVLKDI